MSRHLHIISSNCPFPPNQGRSIDVFEKIIAFHRQGIKIHLHHLKCRANHNDIKEVNKYCESVNIYEGETGMNESLRDITDDFPFLIEGNLCSRISNPAHASARKVLVRFHDLELETCKSSLSARNLLSKIFLHRKQNNNDPYSLYPGYVYVCITEKAAEILREEFRLPNVIHVPQFISWHEVKSKQGMGSFCLYHGNLSIPANEKAATWLLEKIFSQVRYPFVIAGKDPSRRIYKLAQLYSHSCIVANPSENEIDDLIQKAHINILPSLNPACGKYKLLHALFSGRHCVTNEMMIKDTELGKACHIANDTRSKIGTIKYLMERRFTEQEVELRKDLLSRYNNSENILKLIQWLY